MKIDSYDLLARTVVAQYINETLKDYPKNEKKITVDDLCAISAALIPPNWCVVIMSPRLARHLCFIVTYYENERRIHVEGYSRFDETNVNLDTIE